MKKSYLKFTTAADGSATVTDTRWITGELCAVVYVPGDIDTAATVTVTCEGPISKAILTKANAGTANVTFYPRDLVNAVADGAALTGTAGGDRTEPLLDGKVKVVIASGGNVKSGGLFVYYED
jgi:hypothetical protein